MICRTEERDDWDGDSPPCARGHCKWFKGGDSLVSTGCPVDWARWSGAGMCEELCSRIIALSPLDGEGLPSAQAYPWVVGSVDVTEEQFQAMLLSVLVDERNAALRARREAIRAR